MEAVKYLKEKRRMIESLGNGSVKSCIGSKCAICPLSIDNNKASKMCPELEGTEPEKAIAIVEKWSKENPQKTILQDFLEKHPNAPLRESGLPKYVCPNLLGYIGMEQGTCPDCVGCWNRPLEG